MDEARLRVLRGIKVTEDDRVRAHAMLTRMKVAAAVAVLHSVLTVSDLFWQIAGAIMDKSDATRSGVLHLLAETAEREAEARGPDGSRRGAGPSQVGVRGHREGGSGDVSGGGEARHRGQSPALLGGRMLPVLPHPSGQVTVTVD